MLKISVFGLFMAAIPEAFLFTFGVYILVNEPFNYRRIAITGLLTGVATYFVRLLPLFPGSNMIFITLISTVLLVYINKIYIIRALSSFLTLLIIRLITEWLNLLVLIEVLKMDLNELADQPLMKTIAFLPSVLVFAVVIVTICLMKRKNNRVNSDVFD